jgi:hypothetical protein
MRYFIEVAKHRPKLPSKVSEIEYQRFAEQFVEMVFASNWVFQHLLYGGFQTVPTWEELNSGEFALAVVEVSREGGVVWQPGLAYALIDEDRQWLVRYFKRDAQKRRLSKDELVRLLEACKHSVLRKSFKELARPFSSQRGPKPKLPLEKYDDVLKIAELLRPTIAQLLRMETTRTLAERLEFLQNDHPEACEFLLRRVVMLRQALDDAGLRTRASKRIDARARVLADALAGSDYALSFRTSLERVGEARRFCFTKTL